MGRNAGPREPMGWMSIPEQHNSEVIDDQEMGVEETRAGTTLPGTVGRPTAEECRGAAGSALENLATKGMVSMAEDLEDTCLRRFAHGPNEGRQADARAGWTDCEGSSTMRQGFRYRGLSQAAGRWLTTPDTLRIMSPRIQYKRTRDCL